VTTVSCTCRDLHAWAEDDRQRAVCPIRVCETAVSGMPRRRDYRHARHIAEDADLWRPFVIALAIGICAHPAQAAWTTVEIEEAIASRIRVKAIDQILTDATRQPRRRARRLA
jgi:hypothetical protein